MKINKRRKLIKRKVPKDPTQTAGIFRQWQADIRRRFNELKKDIQREVVDKDIFGLSPVKNGVLILQQDKIVLQPRHYRFKTDQEKLDGFLAWLAEEIDAGILEVIEREGPQIVNHSGWQNKYLRACYAKGATNAEIMLKALYGEELVKGIAFEDATGIAYHLRGPVHASKVAELYSRSFHELKGITEAMSQQIGRVLAEGLALGKNPNTIAYDIRNRVDKIGITRARTLARTETAYAQNVGTINHAKLQEKYLDEEIKFQWLTAGDNKVRPEHQKRSGRVFTKDEALELIGDVNCRCALMPYMESVQGSIDPRTRLPKDKNEWPKNVGELMEDVEVTTKPKESG